MRVRNVLFLLLAVAALQVGAGVGCGAAEESNDTPNDAGADAAKKKKSVVASTDDTGGDAGEDAWEPLPTPEQPFPQAKSLGGSVVANPKVMVITFAGDPLAADIADFNAAMATSTYLSDLGKEYGVGPMTALPPVVINETAPSTISSEDIDVWLATKLATPGGPLGAPDSSTLYAIYYPKKTVIVDSGDQSCVSYGGYHMELQSGALGKSIGYAVMPRCSGFGSGETELDVLTQTSSHEYFEWATDPFPVSDPAWADTDANGYPWALTFLPELGDLCVQGLSAAAPKDLGFTVQRQWSNVSSLAGHHPCMPRENAPFVTAFPLFTTKKTVGEKPEVPIVQLDDNNRAEMQVRFHSDDPSAPAWEIEIYSYDTHTPLAFSPSRATGKHGDTVKISVSGGGGLPDHIARGLIVANPSVGEPSTWPLLVTDVKGATVPDPPSVFAKKISPKASRSRSQLNRAFGINPASTAGDRSSKR